MNKISKALILSAMALTCLTSCNGLGIAGLWNIEDELEYIPVSEDGKRWGFLGRDHKVVLADEFKHRARSLKFRGRKGGSFRADLSSRGGSDAGIVTDETSENMPKPTKIASSLRPLRPRNFKERALSRRRWSTAISASEKGKVMPFTNSRANGRKSSSDMVAKRPTGY